MFIAQPALTDCDACSVKYFKDIVTRRPYVRARGFHVKEVHGIEQFIEFTSVVSKRVRTEWNGPLTLIRSRGYVLDMP
jgi:tRNA A37 threonylcarbamoyladenosine synthetase subunit TsaC/SUA5/YrdC